MADKTAKRFCKYLELRDNQELIDNYKEVHAKGAAWPEITQGMRDVGITDMEIYLLGNRLFMFMETTPEFDHDRDMERLAAMPRQQEWETFVSRFQRSGAEASADEKWQMMERIYKLGE